jgi:hypothetical protein
MIAQAIECTPSATNDLLIAQSFEQLSRSEQVLIRKSRKNAMKAGVPLCHEWMHGNGVLTATQCIYRDIGKRPDSAYKLLRRDKTKEHSATNSYWSYPGRNTGGRPSTTAEMDSGIQISLVRASELSGLHTEALLYRMKTMTIEQAMLTYKSSRSKYPKEKAIAFFANLDLEKCTSKEIQDEQLAYARQSQNVNFVRQTKPMNYDSLTVLSNTNLLQKLTSVLSLNTPPERKACLLAFMACPSEIRRGTDKVLKNIIRRCRDENDTSFHHYGGRGINVCESWVSGIGELSGLHCFVLDVGPQQPCMELDRIDNDKGYNKSNCRWVTRKVNIKNTFRIEDIADRLNAMVSKAVEIELKSHGIMSFDVDALLAEIL